MKERIRPTDREIEGGEGGGREGGGLGGGWADKAGENHKH